jgi:hypothetical protein
MVSKAVKEEVTLNMADKIWNEIKSQELEIFALPNQTVNMYCTPVDIEPSKLYLDVPVSAVLPALEQLLWKKYNVEKINKYVVVSKN